MNRNEDRWSLTTADAARVIRERLGTDDVSETTLRTWRSRGQGPRCIRIGGRVRYSPASVDAWLTDVEDASA